jgi:hypothetical protein
MSRRINVINKLETLRYEMAKAIGETEPPEPEDWHYYAADAAIDVLLKWRDDHFEDGNDKVWGQGNWVRCSDCPDGTGLPSYHHRDTHREK